MERFDKIQSRWRSPEVLTNQQDAIPEKDLIEKGFSYYESDQVESFLGSLSGDNLEKAKKNLSKLVKKQITDSRGRTRNVWVDPNKNNPKPVRQKAEEEEPKAKRTKAPEEEGSKRTKAPEEPTNPRKAKVEEGGDLYGELGDIVNNSKMSQSEKIRALFQRGVEDKHAVADMTGAHYSRVATLYKQHMEGGGKHPTTAKGGVHPKYQASVENAPRKLADVNDRWDTYGIFADMVIDGTAKSLIGFGTGGTGKFLSNDAIIYTPNGTTTHGEVRPGDQVLCPDGSIANVLEIFPHPQVELFRITLADGSSTLAGGPHLWKVWDKTAHWDKDLKKRIAGGRYQVMTTEQIVEKGLKLREKSLSTNGKEIPAEWRFLIPFLPTPVNFNKTSELPVHPYLLGYLIGDGNISGGRITLTIGNQDKENALRNLKEVRPDLEFANSGTEEDISFRLKSENLLEDLKKTGVYGHLSGTKFLPKEYLIAPLADRLELLRGLMDTDGSCEGKRGHCVYYTTSEQLANDVRNLALSFGKYVSLTSVDHKFTGKAWRSAADDGRIYKCYRVYFTMPEGYNPFKLERKANKWQERIGRPDIRGKSIVSIEFEKVDDATCITIDHPEHLYLTDDYITTHNTYTVSQSLKAQGLVMYDEDEGHELGDDNYDAVKITGKATASAVYQAMFEHNGKMLIFDDCDSVLKDEDAVNLFKGALDSTGDGGIAYGGGKTGSMRTEAAHGKPVLRRWKETDVEEPDEDGMVVDKRIVPARFKFKGRVIFISNLPPEKMPQPLIDSRSLAVDLSMTPEQTIDRMRQIIDKMPIEDANGKDLKASMEDKTAVIDFLDKHKEVIREGKLNARTVGNLVKVKQAADKAGKNWEKTAEIMLYS